MTRIGSTFAWIQRENSWKLESKNTFSCFEKIKRSLRVPPFATKIVISKLVNSLLHFKTAFIFGPLIFTWFEHDIINFAKIILIRPKTRLLEKLLQLRFYFIFKAKILSSCYRRQKSDKNINGETVSGIYGGGSYKVGTYRGGFYKGRNF